MKTLKHLLLTNWHYFSHEFIDFGQINFLTGKTGSGKTTTLTANDTYKFAGLDKYDLSK